MRVELFFFTLVTCVIYFVPTLSAILRGHKRVVLLSIANLLTAWTVIGYVLLLMWAFHKKSSNHSVNLLRTGFASALIILPSLVIAMIVGFQPALTPEEIADRSVQRQADQIKREKEREARKAAKAEENKQKAILKRAKAAEEKRQGFHCLSALDGSHFSLKRAVKESARNPKSFKHIETRITPVVNGKHTLFMKYRAENGFGGMTIGTVTASVSNDTCNYVITSSQ
ncbi:MAG: superinfection immunity protein [Pseudomonadota bacterium]